MHGTLLKKSTDNVIPAKGPRESLRTLITSSASPLQWRPMTVLLQRSRNALGFSNDRAVAGVSHDRCRSVAGSSCDAPTASPARSSRLNWECMCTRSARRRRFLKDRVEGPLDEARPGRPRTIDDDRVAAVIERTLRSLPSDATHWSIRSMAGATGFSHTRLRALARLHANASNSGRGRRRRRPAKDSALARGRTRTARRAVRGSDPTRPAAAQLRLPRSLQCGAHSSSAQPQHRA